MAGTVLLVGGGSREHAIAAAIRGGMDPSDPGTTDVELYACAERPNPGIERVSDGFESLDPTDAEAVLAYAEGIEADIAIIGPRPPIEAGVVDALAEADVFGFGPSADGVAIDTDAAYQREFLREHDIPGCPSFAVFDHPDPACDHLDEADGDVVLKIPGVGTRVIGRETTPSAAKEWIREAEQDRVVIEERLEGEEFTVQSFVAKGEIRVTPAVREYSHTTEDGRRTAGVGSYSAPSLELPFMDEDDYHDAIEILYRIAGAIEDYRGALSGRFLLTGDGVSVVDLDVCLGDPGALNTLAVMNTSFGEFVETAAEGDSLPQLSFAPRAAVCKYVAPAGYPKSPEEGVELGVEDVDGDDVLIFYENVDDREEGLYSTTGRSFAAVGIGESIEEAEERVSDALEPVDRDEFYVRDDIGTTPSIDSRIEHVETLRADD